MRRRGACTKDWMENSQGEVIPSSMGSSFTRSQAIKARSVYARGWAKGSNAFFRLSLMLFIFFTSFPPLSVSEHVKAGIYIPPFPTLY